MRRGSVYFIAAALFLLATFFSLFIYGPSLRVIIGLLVFAGLIYYALVVLKTDPR